MPSEPSIIINPFGRAVPWTTDLQREAEAMSDSLGRAIDAEILRTLGPVHLGAIAPMTVCESSNDPLTLDHLRRAFVIAAQEKQWRNKPYLSEVRSWVTHSDHGLANVYSPDTGRDRMFYSMGVVKMCDETPNWNTEAMANGKRWPR